MLFCLVIAIAVITATAAMHEQQQQISGEISSLQSQQVQGQEMMVAEVKTQDGQMQKVILGSKEDLQKLNLKEGDQVSVQGSQTQFQGQSALQARQVRSNGEQVQIKPQAGNGEQKQGNGNGNGEQPMQPSQQIQGRISEMQTKTVDGQEQMFAKVQTQDGQTVDVMLGSPDQLEKLNLQQGAQVSVQGQTALQASQIRSNGEQVQIQQKAGNGEGNGESQQQVQGKITKLHTQIVAEVETQDGQTKQVILGSQEELQKLSLKEGDQISIQGSQTRFQGQSAIQARQVRSNGEQVQIQPPQKSGNGEPQKQGNGEQQKPGNGNGEQKQQVQGKISRLQTQLIEGQAMVVAEIETQDGQKQQVLLGSPDQLQKLDLKEGAQIRVQGSQAQVQGQSVLKASEVRSGDQQVKIEHKQPGSSR